MELGMAVSWQSESRIDADYTDFADFGNLDVFNGCRMKKEKNREREETPKQKHSLLQLFEGCPSGR